MCKSQEFIFSELQTYAIYRSVIVNYLQRFFNTSDNVAVAFIYCNYKTQHTLSELIAAILKQIAQDHLTASNEASLLKYKRHKSYPMLEDLLTVLKIEMKTYSSVFIVIDALDECQDNTRGKLLGSLRALPGNVKLLVTSRRLPSIAVDFQGDGHLPISANDNDMRTYIMDRIGSVKKMEKQPVLREEIVSRVLQKADGMYVLLNSFILNSV